MCCVDSVAGIDKGTLDLFKHLSNMPLHVWTNFLEAGEENAEGEKLAAKLIKLSQAHALCNQYSYSYESGYKEGYKNGYNVGYAVGYDVGYDEAHKEAEEKDSVELCTRKW